MYIMKINIGNRMTCHGHQHSGGHYSKLPNHNVNFVALYLHLNVWFPLVEYVLMLTFISNIYILKLQQGQTPGSIYTCLFSLFGQRNWGIAWRHVLMLPNKQLFI